MKNRFEVRKEFSTNQWSGGSTTEFYLYRRMAVIKKKRFSFSYQQCSSGGESQYVYFTAGSNQNFNAVGRKYETDTWEKEPLSLMPGKCDVFSGDVKTVSVGLATDFNLMVKDGT